MSGAQGFFENFLNRLHLTNSFPLVRTTHRERRCCLGIIATHFRKRQRWVIDASVARSRTSLVLVCQAVEQRTKTKTHTQGSSSEQGALTRWPAWLIGDRQGGVEESGWDVVQGRKVHRERSMWHNRRQKQTRGGREEEEKQKAKTKMGQQKKEEKLKLEIKKWMNELKIDKYHPQENNEEMLKTTV